ncbi:hypothetical protein CCAX7_001740 [Capsulimonas corticalis]|uniref:Uncharacterized protein n=2 Tax=Capsulimonas corticalis TaxID=2219043 RepID=A0A402CRP4_9BACT|nr:hypothetical protein CCAX7_001740 [Capsulimonas corticalis]
MVYEGVCCPICKQEIDLDAPYFATSEPFFPSEHPLFKYCDAAMHWDCYAAWPSRSEFARRYFETQIEGEKRNYYWGIALSRDEVAVTVSIDIGQVIVMTAETGDTARVGLNQWEEWLADFDQAVEGLHPVQQDAFREVWPILRDVLPSATVMVRRVDWEAKNKLLWARVELCRIQEEERLRTVRTYNKACQLWINRGGFCPYCGADNPRFEDRGPERKSEFHCIACGQSFGPPEANAASSFGVYLKDAPT